MKRVLAITASFWLLFGAVAGAQSYTESEGGLTVDPTSVAAGDTVPVSGDGFSPNTDVEVVLSLSDGTEVILGSATAGEDGAFSTEVDIPDNFDGNGVLFARGTSADGGTRVLGVRLNGGQVGQLAFTGASSRTPWLISGSAALIIVGTGALLLGNRRRVLR
jgi:hypothetical protein